MKKLNVVLLFLLVVSVWAAKPLTEPAGERKIQISDKISTVLSAGKVQIVVAPEAYATTRFAASELSEHLSVVLDAKVPVVTSASAGMIPIYLGKCKENSFLKIDELDRDGYFIIIKNGTVHIAGQDDPKTHPERSVVYGTNYGIWQTFHQRGTLFGVYEFLERFAECRFYFPGRLGTVLPKKMKIALPETEISDRPDWPGRHMQGVFSGCAYYEGPNPTSVIHPMKIMQLYRMRFSTQYPIAALHGSSRMNFVNRFAKTHPEYFAMKEDGTRETGNRRNWGCMLCFSSKVSDELFEDYKAMFIGDVSKRPGLEKSLLWGPMRHEWVDRKMVDVMPGDAFMKCACPKCQAAFTREGNYATELVWKFIADMGFRMQKAGFKDAVMAAYSYYPFQDVPQCELPSNVEVEVCVTGPYDKYNPKKLKQDNELIKNWHKKLGKKVFVANYGYKRGMEGIPNPTPKAYAEYYKSQMPWIGGVGVFYNETDRFMYTTLQDYVFSKVAWNNQTDVEILFKEYYTNMFGPAAAIMRTIMERFEDIWMKDIGGRTIETDLGPMSSYPSTTEIWSKTYTKALMQQIEKEFAQAENMTSGIQKERVLLFKQEFLLPLKKARDNWEKNSSLPEGIVAFLDTPVYLTAQKGQKDADAKTLVTVSKNANELIVKFDCFEKDFGKLSVADRKFDDPMIWNDDSVEIFLDPEGRHETVYHLLINAKGQYSDAKIKYCGKEGIADWKYNTHAGITVSQAEDRWSAVVRIPLASLPGLRYDGIPANFCRSRVPTGGAVTTYYCWSPFTQKAFGDVELFGRLVLQKSIITNYNFTQPLDHRSMWGRSTPGIYELDTTEYFSAPSSIKITSDRIRGIGHTIYGLKPNTKYRMSCVIKTKGIVPCGIIGGACLKFQDAPNHQIWIPSPGVAGDNDWRRYTTVFTTASKLDHPMINAWIYNGKGTAWIDDISLEEIK